MFSFCCSLASCFFVLLLCFAGPTTAENVRIIDGDTFDFGEERYRLFGIDAPEVGQRCLNQNGQPWDCGSAATKALIDLTHNRTLRCEAIEQDPYGRIVAKCFASGLDLGSEMVATGMAWAFVKYSDAYVVEEFKAREERIGIWQGDAQPAWGLREDAWALAVKLAPEGCPIKGNISARGKIYHMPWSKSYAKTRINLNRGERWFCDEADALAAGWRPPQKR